MIERSPLVQFHSFFPDAISKWDLLPLPTEIVESAFNTFSQCGDRISFDEFASIIDFIRIIDGIEAEASKVFLQDIFIDLFGHDVVNLEMFSANFNRYWCRRRELYKLQRIAGARRVDLTQRIIDDIGMIVPDDIDRIRLKQLREDFVKLDSLRLGRLASEDQFITWSDYKRLQRNLSLS